MHIEAHHIDIATLVLRVAFGISIFAHGYNKVFGKGGLNRTAKWFARMGMRAPKLQARMAAFTEISAGIALAIGFATPIATAALIALMIVAIVVAHRKNGYFIFRPGQGWEYCAAILIVAAVIALLGPGNWSVDSALNLNYTNWFSFTIAIGLGFGSAVAQLAAFWRPPPTSESN
ncbi:MAG: DoxX family protein [Ilumatobacteraceae bacterium]